MIDNSFRNHGIWDVINSVKNRLDNFSEKAQLDPRFSELLEKIDYVEWILQTSNPHFLSENELQKTINELNQILNHIENDAGSWSHYNTISNSFASILTHFPYPRVKKIFRSEANEAIAELTQKVGELTGRISEARNETENGLIEANEGLEAADERLEALASSLQRIQSRVDTQLDNWETEFSSQVTAKLSEYSERFSNAQLSRNEDFEELKRSLSNDLEELSNKVNETSKANEKEIGLARASLKENEKSLLESSDQIIGKLNQLYQQAGQDMLAADFAGNAAQEKQDFVLYSRIAAFFFVVAAMLLGFIWANLAQQSEFKISELFMRLPISAVFLLPAFYFSSLASGHRKSSIQLRSLGLRIKAFDAYLTNSSVEDPEGLKREMAKEFFEEKTEPTKTAIFSKEKPQHFDTLADLTEKVIDKVPTVKN